MKKLLLLLTVLIFTLPLNAAHILSSNMRYNCIDEGTYEIELEMYRDCFAGGAEFDEIIEVGIYEGEEYKFSVSSSLTSFVPVVYNGYEDCDPDADLLCVEKGIYTFTVEVPISTEEYTIAYMRCCWADDILNILEAGATGITALTTISAEAQQICNKQLGINFPLAFTSCPDVPLELELPLVDSEGDTYEYEICLPYEGGGPMGSADNPGDPTTCESVTPAHPCYPPYNTITLADGFDEDNIFPTLDGITVDNVNGTLSFTPTTQGRYVYSICFTEYRDGEVIGLGQSILQLSNKVSEINKTAVLMDESWSVQYFSSSNEMMVEVEDYSGAMVIIYNIEGKLLKLASLHNTKTIISTSGYANGTYVVQIKQGEALSSKKVAVY